LEIGGICVGPVVLIMAFVQPVYKDQDPKLSTEKGVKMVIAQRS
jgi:hypothetical protein